MATTTNFGWETPDDTDLVKDGAAAIRTLGSNIDTSLLDLKGGTTGQVLAKASNTDMDFVWSADAAGMTNPMTTTGDTIYSSSGSTPARLGIGSTGQILTVSGGLPVWAAAPGGGKVLQVVQGTRTSDTSTTSTSLVDTNLTVTITPTLATSKIMIFVSHPKVKLTRSGTAPANYGSFVLLRGATQLQESMTGSEEYTYSNGVFHNSIPFSYLDSPATTSATTYKTQFSVINANITALISGSATVINSIVAMEIGA